MNEAASYVFSLVNRLTKVARRQFAGDDASAEPAMMAMLFQPEADGSPRRIRMTDISRQLMISKPAATQAINRLVEKGLAERIPDKADRRVVYIQATPEGLEVFEYELNQRLKLIDVAIERIGLERAAQLGELLNEFVDALVSASEE